MELVGPKINSVHFTQLGSWKCECTPERTHTGDIGGPGGWEAGKVRWTDGQEDRPTDKGREPVSCQMEPRDMRSGLQTVSVPRSPPVATNGGRDSSTDMVSRWLDRTHMSQTSRSSWESWECELVKRPLKVVSNRSSKTFMRWGPRSGPWRPKTLFGMGRGWPRDNHKGSTAGICSESSPTHNAHTHIHTCTQTHRGLRKD